MGRESFCEHGFQPSLLYFRKLYYGAELQLIGETNYGFLGGAGVIFVDFVFKKPLKNKVLLAILPKKLKVSG